jgi:hypothetical protein
MIRGLDLFREHFAEYRKAFVIIGGVACHEWLSTQGLEFRATKDMDMVLNCGSGGCRVREAILGIHRSWKIRGALQSG